MKNETAQKKLLFLGGVQRSCAIVKRAQELGAHVTVADYYEDSPAKKIADAKTMISATDIEGLTAYCLEHRIDGATTAYADILLKPCYEVAKRIGRPFYATELMIEMATDKTVFKKACNEYHVPVPKTYPVSYQNYVEAADTLEYPVFIKPVDASGSRGANVCYSAEDFIRKYEYALSFSRSKTITVEEFLTGTEFILDYVLVDGEPYLVSMADRFTTEGRPAAINHPNLMILPSANLHAYYRTVHPKVVEMFRSLGFRNGVIFLQGYANEKKIAFYEMGCRLGGTWPYIDEAFTGVNPLDLLITHALTGEMMPPGKDPKAITPFFDGYGAVLYFIATEREGTIAKVTGVEELSDIPEVVSVLQYYWQGDTFSIKNFTDVLFLGVHVAAPDYDSLNRIVEHIYETVDYQDETGRSFLTPVIHLDQATHNRTKLYKPKEISR